MQQKTELLQRNRATPPWAPQAWARKALTPEKAKIYTYLKKLGLPYYLDGELHNGHPSFKAATAAAHAPQNATVCRGPASF